jgi:hypothetical protein
MNFIIKIWDRGVNFVQNIASTGGLSTSCFSLKDEHKFPGVNLLKSPANIIAEFG